MELSNMTEWKNCEHEDDCTMCNPGFDYSTNGHTVKFSTRLGYGGWGDIEVDGEDLGWNTLEDAQALAASLTTELIITHEDDYVLRNPRRGA
jgi:hypothetical protein